MKNERARHGEVDFWRGFVLLCIFVNHIPGNLLEDITPRNFGLSDASEAFVFLSGLSLAMASWSRPATVVTKRCVLRAFHLYRAHLVMTFTAISLFAVLAVLTDRSDLLQPDGRATVFDNTRRRLQASSLGHQLGYFNILPLYIVLMLWAPLPLNSGEGQRTVWSADGKLTSTHRRHADQRTETATGPGRGRSDEIKLANVHAPGLRV